MGLAIVLRPPASTTNAALLLSALPTGTGPFMLAELYRREASITARTILITTVVSIFTIWLLLHLISGATNHAEQPSRPRNLTWAMNSSTQSKCNIEII